MEGCETTRDHVVMVVLNVVYLVFGGSLFGCMVWNHLVALTWTADDVTGLGVCGVLLIVTSLSGIVVILLRRLRLVIVYVCVMAGLVVVVGVLGGACVGADSDHVTASLVSMWTRATPTTKQHIQTSLNCCGFTNPNFPVLDPLHLSHPSCTKLPCCVLHPSSPCCSGGSFVLGEPCPCTTCSGILQHRVNRTMHTAGFLALTTAMVMLFGTTWVAVQVLQRHRERRLEEDREDDLRRAAATAPYRRF